MAQKPPRQEFYNIHTLEITNSKVLIRRRYSLLRPWENWQRHITLNGQLDAGEPTIQENTLYLNQFEGTIYVPSQRKTQLHTNNSRINGDHPLGSLVCTNTTLTLDSPTLPTNLGESIDPVKEPLQDLAAIGLTTLTAIGLSTAYSTIGTGWELRASGIAGAGTGLGIRGRNLSTLLISGGMAAGLIFGPEIFGHETIDLEDAIHSSVYLASGLIGKGIREGYKALIH